MRVLFWIVRILVVLLLIRLVVHALMGATPPGRRPRARPSRAPQERSAASWCAIPTAAPTLPKPARIAVGSGDDAHSTSVRRSAGTHEQSAVERVDDAFDDDIVEIGRRLWTRGFVASNDGNISVRLGPDRLLMTPASVSKGFMTPEMMVVTDLDGKVVEAAPGPQALVRSADAPGGLPASGRTSTPSSTRIRRSRRDSPWPAFRSTAPCSRRW